MNDVTLIELEHIKPIYVPGKITFDFESLDNAIALAVAQLEDKKIDELDYEEIKAQITRYKALYDGLDNERKKIAKNFKNPLDEFEARLKKSRTPLGDLLDKLRKVRDDIEEHERLLRVAVVRAAFEDECMTMGILKDTFADKYGEYSLKKYFKSGKFELKKATRDEIASLVLSEFEALEAHKANKQAIQEHAQEYDLPAEGYIRHLEDGKSLVDILNLMKSDRDAIVLRKEQQEAIARAEEARKAEIEKMAQENANATIKAIDLETGEILEDDTNVPDDAENATGGKLDDLMDELQAIQSVTYDLRLTFPGGNEQAKRFKEWLLAEKVEYAVLFNGQTQEELEKEKISNVFD
ncbi:TPA: DUF1351 domain-containing protein [Streptococcus suis]|nr:DUF1351 domain-containing protein [Streptococcus suis]